MFKEDNIVNLPQDEVLVLLVLWPSSAAAAPELPVLMSPLLFEVEVDVEPALFVCRASSADRVPVGNALTCEQVKITRATAAKICMFTTWKTKDLRKIVVSDYYLVQCLALRTMSLVFARALYTQALYSWRCSFSRQLGD